jgi:ribosomal protein S18 acetylase RimI-like enzyme
MIRRYEARDFADVSWLNQCSYTTPCTENELRAKIGAGKCWVWEDSPIVVGALITENRMSIDPYRPGFALVWSVTVARNWQRRGIGTALLNEASKTFPELWLHTEPFSDGERLYTKLGWTPARVEYDYYGAGKDAVLMRKVRDEQNL